MAKTYKARIMGWDWSGIATATKTQAVEHIIGTEQCGEGCDGDGHVGSYYLGTVFALTPSGKFYMPWTTNQSADDVERDDRWFTALDHVATKHDGWIESGEGSPTDLYFMRYWPTPERND